LDTFAKFGRGDLIQQKLEFWKEMVAIGMKTPMEMPEPSRSDCHAWGSHPLFHVHASLAGIRPAAPGFAEVAIAPSPGSLTELASTIPHPAGTVSLSMTKSDDTWQVETTLPAGIPGSLHWQGEAHPLQGATRLTLPAGA
jgi:alpha-L-rhamnosidase